ncbi:helix-turn-helix domain-containing protein [Streptomyces sp. NPDC058686]|uniref:AlbA family DNA-binding domain-containing protein n=1 Tax=Streptomyces sp. NPDC058686 TaxID=3346599 RepID=UPI0036640F27
MNHSLFAAAAADLTIERIRALAARPDQVESLTLEFKREYSKSLVTTIAAMGNTYGGLIMVGIADKVEAGSERVVGVDAQETIDKIASGCREKIDPPWEPTFIPVPFDDESGRSVVVVRVDANKAPRPLLIDLKAPIRLSGQNSTADRDRLLRLAREEPTADVLPMGQGLISPRLTTDNMGESTDDFVLRTGITLPMGEAGVWRPLSERAVDALAQALNDSVLPEALRNLGQGAANQFMGFRRLGHNRSRTARLVWQALSRGSVENPVEAIVTVSLPAIEGLATAPVAGITVDVVSRVQRYAQSLGNMSFEHHYPVADLVVLFDGLLKTFVDPGVVDEIARIADIDTALVAQPRELRLISDRPVKDHLASSGLTQIPEGGASYGGTFRANPVLDLRVPAERQEQVDDWLRQLGLDAGLIGMEALLEQYRATTPPAT